MHPTTYVIELTLSYSVPVHKRCAGAGASGMQRRHLRGTWVGRRVGWDGMGWDGMGCR